MSEFEVFVIPLSLILGLGVTRILSGFIQLVRHRHQAPLHWLPVSWAAIILLYNLGYFNVLYDLSQDPDPWTWLRYGSALFQSMLLFLAAGLVFPSESSVAGGSPLEDFETHGRLALIPLGLLLASAPVMNALQSDGGFSLGEVLNVSLALLIGIAIVTPRSRLRPATMAVVFVLSCVGWFYAWAQPGVQ